MISENDCSLLIAYIQHANIHEKTLPWCDRHKKITTIKQNYWLRAAAKPPHTEKGDPFDETWLWTGVTEREEQRGRSIEKEKTERVSQRGKRKERNVNNRPKRKLMALQRKL